MASCRKYFLRTTNILKRYYATEKSRAVVELDADTNTRIEKDELKPRHHPGILKKSFRLPEYLEAAAVASTGDVPPRSLVQDCRRLVTYLNARHAPLEAWQMKQKESKVEARLADRFNADYSKKTTEQMDRIMQAYENEFKKLMKTNIYNWKAIPYDRYTSLNYLFGRAAPEYAVLVRLFSEIIARDPSFVPKTFFDFGSGVGTGTWAVRESWNTSLDEYYNVDISSNMHDLAKEILTIAYENNPIPEGRYYQRQFLPSLPRSYDLVLSSYSLFELPSAQTRLETILNLWKKTGRYMVIVESGTNAGFRLVNEARDFILDLKDSHYKGHVFSPCPHDLACPRLKEERTPCNFEVNYMDMKLTQNKNAKQEYFSYVILCKGERSENDMAWPRIVRPTMPKRKHTICRMCCSDGNLQEIIFTASKHGKIVNRCAKVSDWGDRLPISISNSIAVKEE